MNNYMYDKDFLIKLSKYPIKNTYIRMIAFDVNGYPKEQIEGRVQNGSISYDGKSNIQRTCTFQMISDNNATDAYWALKTQVKIEIGLDNAVNTKDYDNIIWFNQGIYILSNFSMTKNTNSYSYNISGKDKMCLLNGDLGGAFNEVSIDFGKEEYVNLEDGTITYTKIPVKQIVRNLLILYSHENEKNLIINDIPDYGIELLEYRGKDELYWVHTEDNSANSLYVDGEIETTSGEKLKEVKVDNSVNAFIGKPQDSGAESFKFATSGKTYYKSLIQFGQTCGYHPVPLTYPDDLIAGAGDSITSVLDKIVSMLGNYEYFYNVDGQFVFQEKKNYLNTTFSPVLYSDNDYIYVEPYAEASDISFDLSDEVLSSNIQQTSDIASIRNDFSVWGTRKTSAGQQIPCGIRYAIDNKPESYKDFDGTTYKASDVADWRELIYRMAKDYFAHNQDSNFLHTVETNNTWAKGGRTGYEQYYTDIEGFWLTNMKEVNGKYVFDEKVMNNPETMLYWLEFLSPFGDLEKYSIKEIGRRSKAVNDNNVTAVFFQETPSVLFKFPDDDQSMFNSPDLSGYDKGQVQVPERLVNYFVLSAQNKSAKDVVEDLIYENTYVKDSITLTTVPMYFLQTNTRIKINDGEYNLDSINFQFGTSGNMNINLSRILPSLYRY